MILFYFSQEMCFFVKQKTAYEMRISDWSSDVCSSDLPVQGVLVMLWETMGLMLAGMALFRAHMLTGEWAAGRYRKWAIVSRSEERREGKECVRTCRSRRSPYH